MSRSDPSPQLDDRRVEAVLGEYLRRLDAGQQVDHEEFLAEHADIADALREHFEIAEVVIKMAGPAVGSDEEIAARAADTASLSRSPSDTHGPADTSPSSVSGKPAPLIPEEFGRYRILRQVGQGAMGAVFLAQDTELDREVALKIPKLRGLQEDDVADVMARFFREARSAATLRHANICPIYDVGEFRGTHYITMAFIDGKPLSDYIRSARPLSERSIAKLVRKLALALEEAHAKGIVHRDLKPANIMIDRTSEPIITDFGLARQFHKPGEERLTHSGAIVGSPAYMSPEQADGGMDHVEPASDIYSLVLRHS